MKQKGFTIIELVIVLGVSSILLLGLMNLFDWHHKVYVLEQADVRAQTSARNALLNMAKYIAQATEIEASRTVGGTLYTSGGSALVLEVPSQSGGGNSDPNIIPNNYDYITYYVSGGGLYQVIEPGGGSVRKAGTKQLAEGVDTFSLSYNNGTPALASSVVIDLQTRITTRGSSSVTAHVTDTIFLRNR
jgi:prepilin-type N-terminal cleavage/methylation domain-containing protein